MAGSDGSLDASRDARWPDNVCADRRHEGIEPRRRARVRAIEGQALGKAQAEERPMTTSRAEPTETPIPNLEFVLDLTASARCFPIQT
jgi:hypothetical protein